MKKFLLSLAMAITAIGASAQNTFNVRAGGAVLSDAAVFTTMAQEIYHLIITDHGHFLQQCN